MMELRDIESNGGISKLETSRVEAKIAALTRTLPYSVGGG
jgi:hypothetical protein